MMVSESYFCIQLKLTMKSRTCENEEKGGWGGWMLVFELIFLIVFYVINKVVLVINLDDSYFHNIGHFTLYEHLNLKVSIYIFRQVVMHVQTNIFFLSVSLFLVIDLQSYFLL
jgi:hypothetical protein